MRISRMPQWGLLLSAGLYRFRESLFLLPALVVVGGIALAEVTRVIDDAIGKDRDVPLTLSMTGNSATWLLSTVAGAMITTAGVVFSLTVVSLQLASSQFSPRVMRSFIRDRLSQVVIGLLVATFVYGVLTLRQVGDPADPAPAVSVTTAVVLTVVTVLLIVAHLDHLAHGLQVGEVVRSISGEGNQTIATMLTASVGEHSAPQPDIDEGSTFVVPATRDGWVTRAPSKRLLATVPPGTTVRLETRTGAYIHEGEPLATLSPAPDDPDRVLRTLGRTVVVADTRTMQEDVDFAIRQLVDIGLRALSPAINDPTTAVEVSLRLGSLLRRLLAADLPPTAVAGPDGRVLERPWDLRQEEYVAHAFDQMRHAAVSQPQVASALLRVLRMLIAHVQVREKPDVVAALERQMELLLEAVDATPGVHSEDEERVVATAADDTDPAFHGRRHRRGVQRG